MLIISFILMIISRMLWTLHDLYFWGKDSVRKFVDKIGWHVIKGLFMIAFFFSAFLAGRVSSDLTKWGIIKLLFALALVAWGAFEGLYSALHQDAKVFDWFRYLRVAITKQEFKDMPMNHALQLKEGNTVEFILHHVFRLHWIEAVIVICMSILCLFF